VYVSFIECEIFLLMYVSKIVQSCVEVHVSETI